MNQHRNKVLIVDIDPEREGQVVVAHGNRNGDDIRPTDGGYSIVSDMASLCEALCTLIHTAEDKGAKPSHESLTDCIHHLEQGTFDASYFTK